MSTKIENGEKNVGFLGVSKGVRNLRIKILEWRINNLNLSAYDVATSSFNFVAGTPSAQRLLSLSHDRYMRRDRLQLELAKLNASG